MRKIVDSVEAIYGIRFQYNFYNEIILKTASFKYSGALRYAIKYAFWALKPGGTLQVVDEPSQNDGISKSSIDFWQIKHEFFKLLKTDVKLTELDAKDGSFSVLKLHDSYLNNGISFGVVFSGSDAEISSLTQCISAILKSADAGAAPCELVVSGPSSFDGEAFLAAYRDSRLRYLVFDFPLGERRIPIARKKAALYERSRFDIVVICHTRISVAENFVRLVFHRKFDAFTPRVDFGRERASQRYLDYSLIGSYDLLAPSGVESISNAMVGADYLHLLKRRVPYMDGGINVFNKKLTQIIPYNSSIAWNEGEDVLTAQMLMADGNLIDYFDDIICHSSTSKIDMQKSKYQLAKLKLKRSLVRRGFY